MSTATTTGTRPTSTTQNSAQKNNAIAEIEREGAALDLALRRHPIARILFWDPSAAASPRRTYLALLRLKRDYVQFTVPALAAASLALLHGGEQERAWAEALRQYCHGEAVEDEPLLALRSVGDAPTGHEAWLYDDMRDVLGLPEGTSHAELLGRVAATCVLDGNLDTHPAALAYASYFIEDARRHPYAILGAKGVLEHFSVLTSKDLSRGARDAGAVTATGRKGTSFLDHHGELDVEHTRQGMAALRELEGESAWNDVLAGAYFAAATYRSLLKHYLG